MKQKTVSYKEKIYDVYLDQRGSLFNKPSIKIYKRGTSSTCGENQLIYEDRSYNVARLYNIFENKILKQTISGIIDNSLAELNETIINLDEI